jgi:hypothetical protein
MQSLLSPHIWIATQLKLPSEIPIGTHNWEVTTENGLCDQQIGHVTELTFSQCYPNKYTCNSGHCIPLRYALIYPHNIIRYFCHKF